MRGRRVVTAAGLLVLAGCSSGPSASDEGALSAYLGEYAARMHAGDAARAVAVEEEIASCMHAQGFDYEPRPDGAWQSELSVVPRVQNPLAWAKEHGYGMVDASTTSVQLAPPDPNADLLAAMSASERDAYDEAMVGAAADDPLAPVDGCAAPAEAAMTGAWQDPTYEHYLDEALLIEESVRDHARVTAATTAWRDCVAERGHPELEEPGDGRLLMDEEIAPFQSGGPGHIPAAQKTRLLALEIELATTEAECDDEVGLTRTRDELISAAQEAFVEEHRDELADWELSWPAPSPSS